LTVIVRQTTEEHPPDKQLVGVLFLSPTPETPIEKAQNEPQKVIVKERTSIGKMQYPTPPAKAPTSKAHQKSSSNKLRKKEEISRNGSQNQGIFSKELSGSPQVGTTYQNHKSGNPPQKHKNHGLYLGILES
jgi:hypothetical protein